MIKAEGQLADFCQRINVLSKYEKIVLNRPGSCQWFESLISVFPTIPEGKIGVRPNNPFKIKTHFPHHSSGDACINIDEGVDSEQPLIKSISFEYPPMYPGIIKKIRNVIDQRIAKQAIDAKEENLLKHIRGVESQLRILTELVMKANTS